MSKEDLKQEHKQSEETPPEVEAKGPSPPLAAGRHEVQKLRRGRQSTHI